MNSYEPLKITARIRTGVVADQWLPLDAVLDYQVKRERFGPQVATLPGGGPKSNRPDPDVPLKVYGAESENWYYACSWAQPQPWWAAEGTDHWNKRFDTALSGLVDFGKRRGKVIIEQGQYKAYHMPIFYRVADHIEWYCVGNRERTVKLLATVTHIGKKRSQGWGRVASWKVEQWPDDWSVRRNDYLTRGIPVLDTTQPVNLMLYGLHPPYYARWNQFPIAVPR